MKFDLPKLMQERLAEINKIRKKSFLKDEKSYDIDSLLNFDKKEKEIREHSIYFGKTKITKLKDQEDKIIHTGFLSKEDLDIWADGNWDWESNYSPITLEGLSDLSKLNDAAINKIKDYVNCDDGDVISVSEYGDDPSFEDYNEFSVISYSVKSLINSNIIFC